VFVEDTYKVDVWHDKELVLEHSINKTNKKYVYVPQTLSLTPCWEMHEKLVFIRNKNYLTEEEI